MPDIYRSALVHCIFVSSYTKNSQACCLLFFKCGFKIKWNLVAHDTFDKFGAISSITI